MLIALMAGCGGGKGVNLGALRRSSQPVFYVGESFEGLRLEHADQMRSPRHWETLLDYGTCNAGGGPLSDSGCEPPLEIKSKACGPGNVIVMVWTDAKVPGRAARAARALRPLNEAARRIQKPRIFFDLEPLC